MIFDAPAQPSNAQMTFDILNGSLNNLCREVKAVYDNLQREINANPFEIPAADVLAKLVAENDAGFSAADIAFITASLKTFIEGLAPGKVQDDTPVLVSRADAAAVLAQVDVNKGLANAAPSV